MGGRLRPVERVWPGFGKGESSKKRQSSMMLRCQGIGDLDCVAGSRKCKDRNKFKADVWVGWHLVASDGVADAKLSRSVILAPIRYYHVIKLWRSPVLTATNISQVYQLPQTATRAKDALVINIRNELMLFPFDSGVQVLLRAVDSATVCYATQ